MAKIQHFDSDKVLTKTLFNNFGTLLVFTFYSETNQQSLDFKNNFQETIPLFGDYPNVKYYFISLQKSPETFKKFNILNTPTTIFTQTDKKIIKSFQNQDVGTIFDSLSLQHQQHQKSFQKDKLLWHPKIKSILNESQVIIFIKGTVENPKCGFTQTLLQLLKKNQVSFSFYDILEDQYMRYWLRNYSGWPTYPQIHVAGKLIGGLDVFKDIISKGELEKIIPKNAKNIDPEERFNILIQEYKMLILINKFSYQDPITQQFIKDIKQSEVQKDVAIYNIGLDEKLLDVAIKRYGDKFPILIDNGNKKLL